jgi:hypothetical protein
MPRLPSVDEVYRKHLRLERVRQGGSAQVGVYNLAERVSFITLAIACENPGVSLTDL